MRGSPKSSLRHVADVAVAEAVRAVTGPTTANNRMGGERGDSGAPPGTFTTAGTDGDGNVITVHPFILDLDEMDDPGAVMI